jgi:recombination protein RecA
MGHEASALPRLPVVGVGRLAKVRTGWAQPGVAGAAAWQLSELSGRLIELCGAGASAALTLAARLILTAQLAGEPVAWLTTTAACVYPPDLAAHGIDLAALPIVRVPDGAAIGRAADQLARSGAFGLLIMTLGVGDRLSQAQATRLLGLAQRHGTALVCLTGKPGEAPSLSPLVSLRGEVTWSRQGPGCFHVELQALKDKRRAPGWRHVEVCHGPPGVR